MVNQTFDEWQHSPIQGAIPVQPVEQYLKKLAADREFKTSLRAFLERSRGYLEAANSLTQSEEGKRFCRLSQSVADAMHYCTEAIFRLEDMPYE